MSKLSPPRSYPAMARLERKSQAWKRIWVGRQPPNASVLSVAYPRFATRSRYDLSLSTPYLSPKKDWMMYSDVHKWWAEHDQKTFL